MALSFKDRVKHTVSVGGSGSLTLGSASSGYQAFAAGDDGGLFPYVIEDGTAWETGYGTYTHSGTAFARTTRTASSTGSALAVSTSAFVFVDLIGDLVAANDLAMQTFITGLVPSKGTGNTANISAGRAYVPAAGKVVAYAGGTNVALGTLGASQWNQYFLTETGTIEASNNANPPSTAYMGNARQGGTGGKRRWLFAVLTNGSSNVIDFSSVEGATGTLEVEYNIDSNGGAPSRVLAAGNTGTLTLVSCAGIVPRYAALAALMTVYITAFSSGSGVNLSTDGTTINVGIPQAPGSSAGFGATVAWIPLERGTPSIYYSTANASSYIDISMYRVLR